jgi:hypothetical protein
VSRALPVFKLMKSYNPAHPMAPGMRAQYEQLMAELENNG